LIRWIPRRLVSFHNNSNSVINKNFNVYKVVLRLPLKELLQRYVIQGLLVIRKSNCKLVRATANRRIVTLSEKEIVLRYNLIIRGLLNYYSFLNQRSDLWDLLSLLRKSCALTLAFKLKLHSAARVFSRFGKFLCITNKLGTVETLLDAYPITGRLKAIKLNFRRGCKL
jgi:hypothetical protein